MCSGRVDPKFVLEAFKRGADGVLVTGCHPGDCHYIDGNQMAEVRMKFLKEYLGKAGLQSERFRLEWISASEGEKFARVVKEMVETVKKLGPNPLRIGGGEDGRNVKKKA